MADLEGAYHQIDKRFGDLISMLEGRFTQIDARFAQVEARLSDFTAAMNARFGENETRFQGLDRKVDGLQCRMTALILVTWTTTILTVLLKH